MHILKCIFSESRPMPIYLFQVFTALHRKGLDKETFHPLLVKAITFIELASIPNKVGSTNLYNSLRFTIPDPLYLNPWTPINEFLCPFNTQIIEGNRTTAADHAKALERCMEAAVR